MVIYRMVGIVNTHGGTRKRGEGTVRWDNFWGGREIKKKAKDLY